MCDVRVRPVLFLVVELDSIYSDPDLPENVKNRRDCRMSCEETNAQLKQESEMLAAFESQRQDLEYAVLTQELMTIKVSALIFETGVEK